MPKRSWVWIAAGWFLIVRLSEYYTLRTDMGRDLTWAGSLRYTIVELGFWVLMTPVIGWWAREFPLERPAVAKNAAILFLLNVATEPASAPAADGHRANTPGRWIRAGRWESS